MKDIELCHERSNRLQFRFTNYSSSIISLKGQEYKIAQKYFRLCTFWWFMLAPFYSCSKPLEAFSARARLGSKIDFVIFARAQLGLEIFSLGSLVLEKFTLVPNTSSECNSHLPLLDQSLRTQVEYFLFS